MSNQLRIFLFGSLTIQLNGQPLALMSRKNEALFVYLAFHAQSPIRRELLATLLWSEKNEKGAMGNLRTALSGLRELSEFLNVERATLSTQADERIWIDALSFEKLEKIVLLTSPSGLLSELELSALTEAVSLYRGEFLEGFTLRDAEGFDEWVRNQRERFHIAITQALQKLVTHYLASEDYQAGIVWAQRLVEIDPHDEAPRRDLMRLLAGSGQTSAALQVFELLKRRLQEEGLPVSAETERLYEQIANSGSRSAPFSIPPVSVAQPPTNMTQPLVTLVGRQTELERIRSRLADERCRLITLVGPGGVGKTRLANEVGLQTLQDAEACLQFQDGVYFITMQGIDQPALLPNAIAGVVGCQMQGVVEPETQLLAYLRPRKILLILDNFEHLLEASELVMQILQQAPAIKVLTTSLEPLNFQGEWLQHINGLPVPTSLNEPDWQDYSAIQLFIRTVEQFDSDFEAESNRNSIIDICQQLQGLPLGILLSASSVRAYSCKEIAAELRRNHDFLATTMRNVPLRHRSLRAVFDYVWNLLTPTDRELLPKLAVFEGGFSLAAAQAVAGIRAQLLVEYADRSLLQRVALTFQSIDSEDAEQIIIYSIHRALHGYFLEKLAADRERYQLVRQQHSDYFIDLLEGQRTHISNAEMSKALATVHNQLANVRSAWHFAVSQGLVDKIAAGYETLTQYYLRTGPFVEGENALRIALQAVQKHQSTAESGDEQITQLLANLLVNICQFQVELGLCLQALEEVEQADVLAYQLEDSAILAMINLVRGRANYYMGAHEKARHQLEQAYQFTAQQSLQRIEAQVELYLGNIYGAQSDYAASRLHLLRGLEYCRRDHDPMTELLFHRSLARIAFFVGDYSEATALNEQVLNGYNNLGVRAGTGLVLNNLGAILHQVGDYERAREHYINALSVLHDIGDSRGQGLTTANLCLLSHHLNDNDAAKDFGYESLAIAKGRNDRDSQAYVLNCLGHVARAQNDLVQAEQLYQQALAIRLELEQPGQKLEPMAGLAAVALERNDIGFAKEKVEQIYSSLKYGQPGGIVELIRVMLVCFDTFKACGDQRSEEIVKLGANILIERAGKISKQSQRRSFLWRVASHRRMITLAGDNNFPLPDWLLKTN